MKFPNYKALLNHMNQKGDVLLHISLWTYSSKRMRFTVSFKEAHRFFDKDMIHDSYDRKMSFSTIKGERKVFHPRTLKIAKIDAVEIKEESV